MWAMIEKLRMWPALLMAPRKPTIPDAAAPGTLAEVYRFTLELNRAGPAGSRVARDCRFAHVVSRAGVSARAGYHVRETDPGASQPPRSAEFLWRSGLPAAQ